MNPSIIFLILVSILGTIALCFSLFFLIKSNLEIDALKKENKSKSDENKKINSSLKELKLNNSLLFNYTKSKKGLLYNYSLSYGKEKGFKVSYEVDIIEVSENKIKVSAYDFSSDDEIGKDPSNRQGILDFMKNRWINKSEIELIMDVQINREVKLNEIFK